ncbi:MAG: NAD(P)/FAD-dependent oxidoreductase [Pseudomonadota bacterium]|nr:NAD(P)/FAD-dependent oxidoreductase [Pseudomonadota bacterium]
MEKFKVTIIGAGIVGLALAARLAPKLGSELLLLEQHDGFGKETSSRNSEVVHAGIYYPKDSLKARLCIAGRRQIYQLCRDHDIAHQRLGKIIVATSADEEEYLTNLLKRGLENGVEELKMLSSNESQALEPQVNAKAALLSPATGIVDSHNLMRLFYQQAKEAQATIAFNSKITEIIPASAGFLLNCQSNDANNDENFTFSSNLVINCAGLGAAQLSRSAKITTPTIHYAKGSYFSYSGRSPLSRLVYPAPPTGGHGLGIHATLDLGGRLRFGPDLEYCAAPDYQVDEKNHTKFATAIQRYLPSLDITKLIPDMAGIRPRLQGPNDAVCDFIIREEGSAGAPGFFNLLGIESPGLTAAPAIADEIAAMINL